MNYRITVWQLLGKDDAVESKFEFFAETQWNANELFDIACRSQRGHYRAWLEDFIKNELLRSSEVSWKKVG